MSSQNGLASSDIRVRLAFIAQMTGLVAEYALAGHATEQAWTQRHVVVVCVESLFFVVVY